MSDTTPTPWGDVAADAGALEQAPATWRVADLQGAEWAMQRLMAAQAEIATSQAMYNGWRQQLDGWLDEVTRRARATEEFFQEHLERYALAVRAQSGDTVKTVKVPSGKVATKAGTTTLQITDPEELDAFVLQAFVLPSIDDGPVALADLVTRRTVMKSALQAEVRIRKTQTGTRWAWPCGHFAEYPLDEWDVRPNTCPVCQTEPDPAWEFVPELLYVEEVVAPIVTAYDDKGAPMVNEVVVPGIRVDHGEPSAKATPTQAAGLAAPDPFRLP